MDGSQFNRLRLELSVKAKNGIDFILAAAITWGVISYVWTLDGASYKKSVLTFIVGSLLLPLAAGLSRLLKTQWKVPSNPLQPLGLVLNFAQLFYFPFLIYVLMKSPDYFVMTYGIITGAHFFPYFWYYNARAYAVMAAVIPVGSLFLALVLGNELMYVVPLFVSAMLFVLAIILQVQSARRGQQWEAT